MPISVIIFLIIIVFAVPMLSIYNLKMIDQIKEIMLPEKRKLYFQSGVNQLFLCFLALWAADASAIMVAYKGTLSSTAILGGFVFLCIAFTVGYITNKNEKLTDANPGLELLKPNTTQEKIGWVAVNLVAATCEEIIFRSVLYQLFLRTTNNVFIAALISAIVFGFSHSVQGIMGIVITCIFGLGLQHLVYLNNGLLIAIIVHFTYNMGTTFLVLRKK